MDPKFVKLEEAAEQLSISTDHLNALREDGKLRAYRDGASWKFRTEEIEKMASAGVPEIEADESGINLDLDNLSLGDDLSMDDDEPQLEADTAADESASDETLGSDDELGDLGLGELELAADESSLSDLELTDDDLDLATGSSAELAIDLGVDAADKSNAEATDSAESGLDLELDFESEGDDPESILLSEAELGDSSDRPPSTIIGKADLDADLDLEIVSDDATSGSDPAMSDVQLADLDDLDSDAGATGELAPAKDVTADFDDIDELEIDLEAESSRILTPEDLAAARSAAGSQAQQKAPEASDLDLELDTDDDYGLAPTSDAGLSDLSAIGDDDDDDLIAGSEIDLGGDSSQGSQGGGAGLTGLSALELDDDDDDDDFVLGDGSDLTLSAADSGINLSPADSGLSLDDAAVELTGSAIGSGLDFGEASGLVSDEPVADFDLTPLAEDADAEEGDDSSQVIALDAFEEQQEADDLLDAGGGAAMPAAAAFGQGAVVPRAETQFSGWNVFFLSLCLILLSLCGMMALDVVRSMWSWDEPYQVNSSLIDSLSGFLFP